MNVKEFRGLPDRERARLAIGFCMMNHLALDDPRELHDEEIERLDLDAVEAFWTGIEERRTKRAKDIGVIT